MKNSKQSLLSYEVLLYKELSKEQIDRRHKFSDKVFKSITIIASFVGAVIWLIFNYIKNRPYESCLLDCLIFIFLILNTVLMLIDVIIFFYTLYGYNDTTQDTNEIVEMIEDYKKESSDEQAIIQAINESLRISYMQASVSMYNENEKHIKIFNIFYMLIFIEMFLIVITFFIELLA